MSYQRSKPDAQAKDLLPTILRLRVRFQCVRLFLPFAFLLIALVMHLLLVISSLGGGGAERVMARLAEAWVASGIQITLATFDGRAEDFYSLSEGISRRAMRDEQGHRRSLWPGPVNRVRWLRSLMLESRPDAIVSFTDRTNVVVLLAARRLGVPVLVSERVDPLMHSPGRLWSVLRRLVYPSASTIVVQTESVADWSRSHFPRTRTRVIPNPAPDNVPDVSALGTTVIIAAGRLTRQKGFDVLIEAFSRIHDRHPAWKLRILGQGDERSTLEQQIAKQQLQQRIELAGRQKDAIEQIAQSGVFVLSSRYEGFPNVLAEAMACGRPVIATDCRSGPSGMIADGENGILVPVDDPAALAAALNRLLSDPELRLQLGRKATTLRESLAVTSILALWNNVLAECGCTLPAGIAASAVLAARAA